MMYEDSNFAYALSKAEIQGKIKETPEDFIVYENLGYDLSGDGEHQYLYIEKKGMTTEALIKELAQRFNLNSRLISYAGLKDKHALTRQWVSIHCPGYQIDDIQNSAGSNWKVLTANRHLKKLKTGVLKSNSFILKITDISAPDALEGRLKLIKEKGVPNYFGPQRFGNNGQNLLQAAQFLLEGKKVKNPFLKGILYSTARAFLFNTILSTRIKQNNWRQALPGELLQLAGTHSVFHIDEPDLEIEARISRFDISPTAPLWGRGQLRVSGLAQEIINTSLEDYRDWCVALENHRLDLAYRPLILPLSEMTWQFLNSSTLQLEFELPKGCYATSVVRELISTPMHLEST